MAFNAMIWKFKMCQFFFIKSIVLYSIQYVGNQLLSRRINSLHINRDFRFPDDFDSQTPTGCAPGLLLVHFDDVVLLHLQSLRSLIIIDPAAVKQESEGGDGDAHSLTVGLLELAHLSGLLHSEVNLVAILS